MTRRDWLALLNFQGGVCPVCEKAPPSGRFVIDHEHVRGWAKMPPERRRGCVRGLLCWTCNRYALARGMNITRANRIAWYLRAYADGKPYRAMRDERWQPGDSEQGSELRTASGGN